MEDNPLNNFLRTNSYFHKTEPNSRLPSEEEEEETEPKPTIIVIFLRNHARIWMTSQAEAVDGFGLSNGGCFLYGKHCKILSLSSANQ